MIDISKYTSKDKTKPVLNYVYVHTVDGMKYAVATDLFRIAEVKVWGLLGDMIQEGYYSPKAWKEITKLLNKESHEVAHEIKEIVTREMAVQIEEDFPDYKKIIPAIDDCESFTGDFSINGDYICELIKSVQNKKNKLFNFLNLKQHNKKTIYFSDDTIIMIMQMNA